MRKIIIHVGLVFIILSKASYGLSSFSDHQKYCLVGAYSPYIRLERGEIKTQTGHVLVWDDGVNKSFKEKLASADLEDTLSIAYPAFQDISKPDYQEDPGRFRNQRLLKTVYGDTPQAIQNNLVFVPWFEYSDTRRVLFNRKNGAARALHKVIKELKKLPAYYHKYFINIGGTYNFRYIAGTKILSPHSYGIAVDLNVGLSDYWRFSPENLNSERISFKNHIPKVIVDIFESHCFIWGGRWYHYDTMHFEYRPEFFCNQCKGHSIN